MQSPERTSKPQTAVLQADARPAEDEEDLLILATPAGAQSRDWRHGLSLFGDLKYPAGFKHFDYVNPGAPKGGRARMIAFGTFDNFN